MDSLTIGDTTITIEGDILIVECDGCVRVERIEADAEGWERIQRAVSALVYDLPEVRRE